jgi:hypothetical protein
VNHLVPHVTTAVHLKEAPRQRVHWLTHSLSHSHSLVHLSLLLSPTLKQGRGEGKEEKGEGIRAWRQQKMAMEIT